jgi:YgiT-type zinc finger domain-containing protein
MAPFSVDRHGCHVHWDAIPAWVCSQCGEPLFDSRAVELIHQALEALDHDTEQLAATV